MKRKYKLIIIILTSSVLTYLIYFCNLEHKINIVALGDGIASGETTYNIDGISYNDYLNEYYGTKKLIKNYNHSFAKENYNLKSLIYDLDKNVIDEELDLSIQQIIHHADIITLGIGEEELVKLAITKDLTKEKINEFIQDYDKLICLIKSISDAKIIIIGFYENIYLDKSNVIILNSEIANMATKYENIFININDLMINNDYYVSSKDFYFNYKGHQEIAKIIIHSL